MKSRLINLTLAAVAMIAYALVAVAMTASPAAADNDGVTKLGANTIPGVTVDIGADTIDRTELKSDVQQELDGFHDTNAQQDAHITDHANTLALHTTELAGHSTQLTEHDGRLGSLETVTASHTAALASHSTLLAQHSATLADHSRTLDEHAKGLAVAMAMPDAWLSDKKQFGIFGAVGGFGDETAFGLAAIGRIDETWTLNAKAGSDAGFKHFGWQIGAGAQF